MLLVVVLIDGSGGSGIDGSDSGIDGDSGIGDSGGIGGDCKCFEGLESLLSSFFIFSFSGS